MPQAQVLNPKETILKTLKAIHARATLALAAVAASAALCLPAAAQTGSFPTKPVTIVSAFPAGSGPDSVVRQVAEKLSKLWGQPVLINNKPGGGGFIAIEASQRAPADGYTLVQFDSEHLSALPHLYKAKGYVTLNNFDPVAPLFRTAFFVAVPTESKWQNMGDLIAAAKAAPGKINFGSWGIGSPGHMGGEQLELLSGLDMTHVAYREMSQLFTSVGSGELQWSFGSLPSSAGIFKAGKLRYIAVASNKRLPQMPNVPTMAEAGGPAGFEVNSFVALLAPKGLAADLKTKIHADVLKVLAHPEVKAKYDVFAYETITWTPEQIRDNAVAKGKIYEELVKRKNISLD
jgi:tripartite-type tricarboxylate transporter receptor subunit TctC